MNNEYNKQNNGGQMNRQFNENKDNVNAQAQKPEQTCPTCCKEPKKGFVETAKEIGQAGLTTVKNHPWEAAAAAAGAIIIGKTVRTGIKRKKEGKSFFVPVGEMKPVVWIKGIGHKLFGKKEAEQPAAEAPAGEQK